MKTRINLIVCLLSALTCSFGEDTLKPCMDDPSLHLFVDDYDIQSSTNLLRVLNKPKKHPGPVLVADQPWEGDRAQAWGSVIQEPDGRLRLWYFAFNTGTRTNELDRGGYAYAESRDGIYTGQFPHPRKDASGALVASFCTLVLFALLNTHEVGVDWLFNTWSAPLILVIAISAAIGFAIGFLVRGHLSNRSND